MTLIYPGGGNCDPNEEPCVGPDCIDPGIGDPDPPLEGCDGLFPPAWCAEEPPSSGCTGACCVDGVCVCEDCSYGEDGIWHVYWACDLEVGLNSATVISLDRGLYFDSQDNFPCGNVPHGWASYQWNELSQGCLFDNTVEHYDNSVPIAIGDTFQYSDTHPPSHSTTLGETGGPSTTVCYTYLGMVSGDNADPSLASEASVSGPWPSIAWIPAWEEVDRNECNCEVEDPPIEEDGCQDPTACNYDPLATIHDAELCCYIQGCMDPKSVNYNPSACCDRECCYVAGCTDSMAFNYNASACLDDGSCCLVQGCMDPLANNYDPLACENDICFYNPEIGFQYLIYCYYFKYDGQVFAEETYYKKLDASSATAHFSATDVGGDFGGVTWQLNDHNGNPRTMVPGDTMYSTSYSYPDPDNILAMTYVGVVSSPSDLEVSGPSQGIDIGTGSIITWTNGGFHPTSFTSDWIIQTQNFSSPIACCDKVTNPLCDGIVTTGCTIPEAYNYNPAATISANSTCEWAIPRWCVGEGQNGEGPYPDGMVPDTNPPITQDHYLFFFDTGNRKTLITQLNTWSTTTTLAEAQAAGQQYNTVLIPGTTLLQFDVVQYEWTLPGTDTLQSSCMVYLGNDIYTGDGTAIFSTLSAPTEIIFGPAPLISYSNQANVSTAFLSSPSCSNCSLDNSGCTDSFALNYDPYAVIDDGTCEYTVVDIYGCTDPLASNYDASATVDDGTCTYPSGDVYGCTDPLALNHDPLATVDDGSCVYGGCTCDMAPYLSFEARFGYTDVYSQYSDGPTNCTGQAQVINLLGGSGCFTFTWSGTVFGGRKVLCPVTAPGSSTSAVSTLGVGTVQCIITDVCSGQTITFTQTIGITNPSGQSYTVGPNTSI